mmetsp:Transcript_4626/g.6823  ORF Transcript_4626/g.6823 Transcript_4626/m.6823 type:complete len:198 (-) Transcript_4626:33-626(-)
MTEEVNMMQKAIEHLIKKEFSIVLKIIKLNTTEALEYKTSSKATMLHLVSLHGDYDTACYLLQQEDQEIDVKDERSFTPFIEACKNGHIKIAEALLGIGAELNEASGYGFTGLHEAAYMGHQDIIELILMTKDVDMPLAQTKEDKNTFIHILDENKHDDILKYIKTNEACSWIIEQCDKTITNKKGVTIQDILEKLE